MDIETLTELKRKSDASEYVYNLGKIQLEYKRLTLKYSPEYQQYKTIKEKEERAKLATMELELELAENKNERNKAKSSYELAELEYLHEDMFNDIEECDCGKCTLDTGGE